MRGAPTPPGAPQGGPSPRRQPWDREVREGSTPSCCQPVLRAKGHRLGGHPQVSLTCTGGGQSCCPVSQLGGDERPVQLPAFLSDQPRPVTDPQPCGDTPGCDLLKLITPPPPPARAVSPSATPQSALTALGVKPPGRDTGGHHSRGVGGQRDGQVDGAGQRHLGPVPGEQVDADSRHRRQLQPGAIGCGDKDGDIPKGGHTDCALHSPSPLCPPYRCRPARPRGRRGRRGPGWGRRRR